MRPFLIACIVLITITACAASSDGDDTSDADTIIVEAEPTPETFDASNTGLLAGVATSPSLLQPGDCFNEYIYKDQSDFLQQITTLVGCDGPHDREAYFATEYPSDPGVPMPPEETLRRWAERACLDEFEDFVGLEYVLSRLEIGAITPTFESWTETDDRKVICYVFPDEDDRRLRSSVANSEL